MGPRVPYRALRGAERHARKQHPDATRIKAIWTPAHADHDVHVEVWSEDGATIERGQVVA